MVNLEPQTIPAPRYAGTIVCHGCFAEYKPGNWWRGHLVGTTTEFIPAWKCIGCPVCGRKTREEQGQ